MMRAITVIIILLITFSAHAETITVEWEYSGTADYYILRRNGVAVARINNTSPANIETHAEVLDSFTLAAVVNGQETGESVPYVLGGPGVSVLPKIIKLKPEHMHGRLSGSQPLVLNNE